MEPCDRAQGEESLPPFPRAVDLKWKPLSTKPGRRSIGTPRPTQSLKVRARARIEITGHLTQRQIAALLGIRQQTVNAIEKRALAKLRRALSKEV